MGGNATKHLGTQRINKQQFEQCCNMLNNMLQQYIVEQNLQTKEKFCVIESYHDKQDFGDIDFLSTIDRQIFEKLVEKTENINIVAKAEQFSYAIEFKLASDELVFVQVDYIKSNLEDFDFSKNFFAFNDLGNLIGRIAAQAGFSFGFDGLKRKIYVDNRGDIINDLYTKKIEYIPHKATQETIANEEKTVKHMVFTKIKTVPVTSLVENARLFKNEFDRAIQKTSIVITKDFDKALKFLGFDVERFKQGFNNMNEVFEFVASSTFFNKDAFLFENRNHKARARDKKRSNYLAALEYFKDKKDRKKQLSLSRMKKEFPNFKTEYQNLEKQIKSDFIDKMVFSNDNIMELLKSTDSLNYQSTVRDINPFKEHLGSQEKQFVFYCEDKSKNRLQVNVPLDSNGKRKPKLITNEEWNNEKNVFIPIQKVSQLKERLIEEFQKNDSVDAISVNKMKKKDYTRNVSNFDSIKSLALTNCMNYMKKKSYQKIIVEVLDL